MTRGGILDFTRMAASALSRQQRSTAVHGILRASIGVALTYFQGTTPMRVSARSVYCLTLLDSRSISGSIHHPLLSITKMEGCQDKSPPFPGMVAHAEKSAVMARKIRVCSSLLASVFFVMPAAAQTPGAELDEVSKPTASAGTKVSASEPHEVPGPAITSLIFAAGYHAVAPQVM